MVGGITLKLSQLRFNTFSMLALGPATLLYKLINALSGKPLTFFKLVNSPTLLTPSMIFPPQVTNVYIRIWDALCFPGFHQASSMV